MRKPGARLTRKEADEAYLRTCQVDLEEDIAISAQDALQSTNVAGEPLEPTPAYKVAPDSCPRCGVAFSAVAGGVLWSHMLGGTRAQCARCAWIIEVTPECWKRLRLEARRRFPLAMPEKKVQDNSKPNKQNRRER